MAYTKALVAYAATASGIAGPIVQKINEVILYPLISLLLGVALLVFLWGVFEYIRGSGNETARTQGARHMIYGILGLVIMVSALAILNIAAGTFDITVPGGP